MAAEEGSGGLASSFTDLMTSLAVIFILLLVAMINNKQQELQQQKAELDETQAELQEAQKATDQTRDDILAKLKEELALLAASGVEVKKDERDPLGLLVIIPEGLLQFRVDRWDIPQPGREFLTAFMPRLARGACAFRDQLSSIVVEGHADSTGTDQHNLKLSQDRSMEVVRQSLTTLEAAQHTTESVDARACFLDLLSASGRGNREPLLIDGLEDRDRSRRVVFKIRVRSFEQRVPIGIPPHGHPNAA